LYHRGGIDVSIGHGEITGHVDTVAEVLPWLQASPTTIQTRNTLLSEWALWRSFNNTYSHQLFGRT
jgi:hypothetical protein